MVVLCELAIGFRFNVSIFIYLKRYFRLLNFLNYGKRLKRLEYILKSNVSTNYCIFSPSLSLFSLFCYVSKGLLCDDEENKNKKFNQITPKTDDFKACTNLAVLR